MNSENGWFDVAVSLFFFVCVVQKKKRKNCDDDARQLMCFPFSIAQSHVNTIFYINFIQLTVFMCSLISYTMLLESFIVMNVFVVAAVDFLCSSLFSTMRLDCWRIEIWFPTIDLIQFSIISYEIWLKGNLHHDLENFQLSYSIQCS